MKRKIDMKNKGTQNAFWSCLALVALIMAIFTGHQMVQKDN